MQHPEKAGTGWPAASTMQGGQRIWGSEALFPHKGGVCGGNTTPAPGNQKPNIWEGPRESKHLQAGGREKQAPGQGRKGRTTRNKTLCPPYRERPPHPNFWLLPDSLPTGRTEHLPQLLQEQPPSSTKSGSQPREDPETGGLGTLPAGWRTVLCQGMEPGHRERALCSTCERQTGHLG